MVEKFYPSPQAHLRKIIPREVIRQLIVEGLTQTEISVKLNTSRTLLNRLLKEYWLPKKAINLHLEGEGNEDNCRDG